MGPERLGRVRTVEAIAAVSTPGRRDAGSIPATRRRSGGRRRRGLARAMPSSPRAGHPLHPMIAGHATGQKQGRYYSDRRSDRRRLRMGHSRATATGPGGVVTLTAIWPACGRRRRRLCNGRHLPPLSHRVAAELAECSAGDQMALDVEEVVDGRMDGEEPLRGRGRFEPLHLSLSSSHRLM